MVNDVSVCMKNVCAGLGSWERRLGMRVAEKHGMGMEKVGTLVGGLSGRGGWVRDS